MQVIYYDMTLLGSLAGVACWGVPQDEGGGAWAWILLRAGHGVHAQGVEEGVGGRQSGRKTL